MIVRQPELPHGILGRARGDRCHQRDGLLKQPRRLRQLPLIEAHAAKLPNGCRAPELFVATQLGFRHRRKVGQRLGAHRIHQVELAHRLQSGAQVAQHEVDQFLRLRLSRDRPGIRDGEPTRLHQPANRHGHEHHEQRAGERDTCAVAPHELARAICGTRWPRTHRLEREIVLEIFRQRRRGLVPTVALPVERLEDHAIEIPHHHAMQCVRICLPLLGQCLALPQLQRRILRTRCRHLPGCMPVEQRTEARFRRSAVRQDTRDQFVEQHADGVHVGPGVDILALAHELLGTHVRRRADHHARARQLRTACCGCRRLRDAEVDDLHHRLAIGFHDHHIRWLDVAVDDALLVRVLHGAAHLHHQPHAVAWREPPRGRIIGDREADHSLHGEVGEARLRRARVVHTGDVRMLHQREHLPLRREARDDFFRVGAGAKDLQRHFPMHRLVLLRQVHHPHAAFAEQPDDTIAADLVRKRERRRERRSGSVLFGLVLGRHPAK